MITACLQYTMSVIDKLHWNSQKAKNGGEVAAGADAGAGGLKNDTTLMCLSIGTPKNNKFSICSKWKIHYF